MPITSYWVFLTSPTALHTISQRYELVHFVGIPTSCPVHKRSYAYSTFIHLVISALSPLTNRRAQILSLSLSLSLIPTSKGQQVGVWPILRYGIRCDGQANCVRELPRAEDSVRYEGKQMNHILSTFRDPIFLSSMMSHFQG